jgi:hypothetical protein
MSDSDISSASDIPEMPEFLDRSKSNGSGQESATLRAALAYAPEGLAVFPLNGKRPLTLHGFKDATTDEARIREYWQKWPDANIGIATGAVSGIIVLDVDKRKGGIETLAQLEKEHGPLPNTIKVKTGDGFHFYFKHPGGHIPCRANILPGIDLKADSGYVVAPPSIHASGVQYEFDKAFDPKNLADAPPWLLAKIQQSKPFGAQAHAGGADSPRSSISLDEINIRDRIKRLIRDGDTDGKYASRSETVFAALRALVIAGCDDSTIMAVMQDPANRISEKPLEKGESWLRGEIRRAREKPDSSANAKGGGANSSGNGYDPDVPEVRCLADVESENVSWLWPPYIPIGKVTSIEGDPGVGKSWFTTAVAADLSNGSKLPGDQAPREPQKTLVVTAEDGLGDTLRPRLDAMGANPAMIHGAELSWEMDAKGLGRLREIITDVQPALVVLDPLTAFMGIKIDPNKANHVRAVMGGLAKVASDCNVSIVVVRHLTKGNRDKALFRGLGSIDIAAACRSILMVGNSPHSDDLRIIAHTKSNLAPLGPSLSYTIKDGKFEWTGEVDISAEDLCREAEDSEAKTARQDAVEFLMEELKDGPVPQKDLVKMAEGLGIAKRTLDRAKKLIHVGSKKLDDHWVWQLDQDAGGP